MKCEMCHKGEAKHPLYTDDKGSEIYVCEECFNKTIDEAAERALREPLPEEPDIDVFEGLEDITYDKKDQGSVAPAAVSAIAELRKALGNPFRMAFNKDVNGTLIDSTVSFDKLRKNIKIKFKMKDSEPEEENGECHSVESEWSFDVADHKNITMKAWCHFGDEHSRQETKYRFTAKDAPIAALAALVSIIGGLSGSKDEIVCDF